MNTWQEQVDFVRGMSASAAKILWILFLSGRSLTNKQLQFACDITDKPVSDGLAWLEFKGLVQNNGKFNGWSLTATAYQLPLPFAALPGEETRKNSDLLPALHGGECRKNSDIDGETRNFSDFLPSSSSCSVNDLNREREEEDGETRNFSDFDGELKKLLLQAGIGRYSRKLQELLNAGLDLEYVRAHIAARERAIEQGDDYPIGWLITKLLDGDPAPVCRCGHCQECHNRNMAAMIPSHLRHIIRR